MWIGRKFSSTEMPMPDPADCLDAIVARDNPVARLERFNRTFTAGGCNQCALGKTDDDLLDFARRREAQLLEMFNRKRDEIIDERSSSWFMTGLAVGKGKIHEPAHRSRRHRPGPRQS